MALGEKTDERTDEELARGARAGSRRSFEELAARYKRRLFVYLRPRVGSDQDAEDLVQETFLKLYRNIAGYDDAFRFSTWLYTSAGRLAIDAVRRKTAERERLAAAQVQASSGAAYAPEDEDGAAEVWRAARSLGGDRYRALWLRYGEDMTIEEIAAVLGRTKLGVRILLHRARTSLAGRFGQGDRAGVRPRTRTFGEPAGE
jgi:RNA polymerase sigma-70 factor (ECF subfamily)